MRRLLALLGACMIAVCLVLPASAESSASKVDLLCTVNSDGDCRVTMTVILHLEAAYNEMTFPVPSGAKDITLNGSNATTRSSAGATQVDISKITRDYVGDASIRIEYTIPKAVTYNQEADKANPNQTLLFQRM